MVTRSVNEAATVHAQSLIRTVNYPGSSSLTLRVTKASLTVRVTIARSSLTVRVTIAS